MTMLSESTMARSRCTTVVSRLSCGSYSTSATSVGSAGRGDTQSRPSPTWGGLTIWGPSARGLAASAGRAPPTGAGLGPAGTPASTLAASPRAEGPHIVSPPQVGDGRLWVSPRPALPTEVADVLYEPQESRDTTVVHRLRAMVDSLNVVIDQDQRSRQRPVWTTDVAGKVFGIDSQFIHVAGIKIPTAALALLPISLPQGNYDEQRRARQLDEMREDLMQAARRTETLRLFKQYVRDLRARKQAERDAARRARGDTTEARVDTVKVVP